MRIAILQRYVHIHFYLIICFLGFIHSVRITRVFVIAVYSTHVLGLGLITNEELQKF